MSYDRSEPPSTGDTTADLATVAPGPDRTTGLLITAAVVLVMLLCGGLVLVARGGGPAAEVAIWSRPSPSPSPARTAPPTPANAAADPSLIVAGQCVVNDGTPENARIRAVTCGPGTYRVTDRIDSTDDVRRCDKVPGYTDDYAYQTTPASLDFVLCLKRQ
jgi:hypothetical protein